MTTHAGIEKAVEAVKQSLNGKQGVVNYALAFPNAPSRP